MDKNNRAIGDTLEKKVMYLLQMRGTHNSGATNDDADLKDDHMIVECKVKSKMAGLGISASLLEKVKKQALKWRREWAIVTRNADGDEFVTVPLNDFAEYYISWRGCTQKAPL